MSGRISWSISFDGLDAQIVKLRTLDTLLNSISRKGGLIGGNGPGGINVNGRGGTTFLPSGGTGAAGGGTAAAAAVAGATIGSSGVFSKDYMEKLGKKFEKRIKDLGLTDAQLNTPLIGDIRAAAARMVNNRRRQSPYKFNINNLGALTGNSMGNGMTIGAGAGGFTGAANTIFNGIGTGGFAGGRPPIIPGLPPAGRGGVGGAGGAGGAWSGGLRNASAIASVAGAGKLAKLFSAFGKFNLIVASVIAVLLLLRKTVQLLAEGTKEGASVFQLSARTARPGAENTRLKAAFGAVGLGGGEYEYQTAQQQFNPKAKTQGVPGTQEVIAALRPAQYANIQQLANMAKQFEEAMKRSESSARQMEQSSAAGQRLSMTGVIIGLKWNAMLEQLAEALSPVIELLQTWAEIILDTINEFLELYNLMHKDKRDLIKPGSERTMGMRSGGSGGGAWEKMGFSFPNPKNDVQQTISSNTGAIAKSSEIAAKYLGMLVGMKVGIGASTGGILSANPFQYFP